MTKGFTLKDAIEAYQVGLWPRDQTQWPLFRNIIKLLKHVPLTMACFFIRVTTGRDLSKEYDGVE